MGLKYYYLKIVVFLLKMSIILYGINYWHILISVDLVKLFIEFFKIYDMKIILKNI